MRGWGHRSMHMALSHARIPFSAARGLPSMAGGEEEEPEDSILRDISSTPGNGPDSASCRRACLKEDPWPLESLLTSCRDMSRRPTPRCISARISSLSLDWDSWSLRSAAARLTALSPTFCANVLMERSQWLNSFIASCLAAAVRSLMRPRSPRKKDRT